MEEEIAISKPVELNFQWIIADSPGAKTSFNFTVEKTLFNRWKWWISTKLFLPGNYKWK
jgi:hypothetical protein